MTSGEPPELDAAIELLDPRRHGPQSWALGFGIGLVYAVKDRA
jgi:hypothetical protein